MKIRNLFVALVIFFVFFVETGFSYPQLPDVGTQLHEDLIYDIDDLRREDGDPEFLFQWEKESSLPGEGRDMWVYERDPASAFMAKDPKERIKCKKIKVYIAEWLREDMKSSKSIMVVFTDKWGRQFLNRTNFVMPYGRNGKIDDFYEFCDLFWKEFVKEINRSRFIDVSDVAYKGDEYSKELFRFIFSHKFNKSGEWYF